MKEIKGTLSHVRVTYRRARRAHSRPGLPVSTRISVAFVLSMCYVCFAAVEYA